MLFMSPLPESGTVNASVRKVVVDATRLELEYAGFSISVETDEGIFSEQGEVDTEKLLSLSEQAGITLAVSGTYVIEGNEIRLTFRSYDVATGSVVATVEKNGRLDLMLDSAIGEAVDEILLQTGVQAPETRTPDVGTPDAGTAEGTDGTAPSGGSQKQALLPADEAAGVPAAPDATAAGVQTPRKHFEFSLGFAPFLTIGTASEYFTIGLQPSFYGIYHFNLRMGQLGLGLYAGLNSFRAEGLIASSDTTLVPIGLDLRYSAGFPLGLFLHISSGPAILTINPNGTGRLSKIIPYAMAGIGFQLFFSEGLGIALDTSFAIFFERQLPIMGYSPSVYLYVKF
jgi:hypothetical protein